MAWLTEGKKPFKKLTRAEKAAWVKERRAVFAANRRAALDLREQFGEQIDDYITTGAGVMRLPTQPNSVSNHIKSAPYRNGRKGKG